MVEYRPLGDEHRDVFFEYTKYAFGPESGPVEYDPDEHESEQTSLGERRGLFDGSDDPRCVCLHYWFQSFIRGEWHSAPGLSAVASPPENRREGYVGQLLEHSLEEYRSRGARFSLLWPFRTSFYRQFGWDTCASHRVYSCEPSVLSFARTDAGRYRPVDADEFEVLEPVYEEFSRRYTLPVDRDGDWWRHRVFSMWESDPYVYAWERDGELRGYLVYTVEGDWNDRTLQVRELVFADHDALLALCAYCANHDSQVSKVEFTLPTDVDLLDIVPEPEDLDCEIKTGAMARIVDASEALSAVQYPDVDADVTLSVHDSVADWNDGTYRLGVEDETGTCERLSSSHDADVTLDISALTQLVVGYRAASDLERTGRIDAASEAVSTLDRLFPRAETFLVTRF